MTDNSAPESVASDSGATGAEFGFDSVVGAVTPLEVRDDEGTLWASLGGPDFALQVRHPGGGYLRIRWDGTIEPLEAK